MIPLIKSKGYKLGVLKNTHEGLPEERAGTDTAKFRSAGAETVGPCGEDHFTLFKAGGHPALPLDRLAAFFFPEADLVVTEGFKKQGFPENRPPFRRTGGKPAGRGSGAGPGYGGTHSFPRGSAPLPAGGGRADRGDAGAAIFKGNATNPKSGSGWTGNASP